MLSSFSVKNFRAFREATIPLSPLTVVVGQNSAGKSSIVSALLLLKQTLEDPAYGVKIPILRLAGRQTDAGNYKDVVHNHNVRSSIEFSFAFGQDRTEFTGPPLAQLDVPRFSGEMRWLRRRDAWITYGEQMGPTKLNSLTLKYQSSGEFGPALSYLGIEAKNGQRVWFTRTTERERVQHWRSYTSGLPGQAFSLAFSENSPLFPRVLRRRSLRVTPQEKRRLAAIDAQFQAALRDVRRVLMNLNYIGPFRTPPKRRYSFSGLGATEAGHFGEQTTDLLVLESLTRPVGHRPLTQGVAFWLRYLGLANALQVSSIAAGSNLFEMKLERAGTARLANIADVGFGLSQVLPVLVAGHLVPRGGLLVVQQPELHLHPDAQAGLADYFLFLSSQGIRCIVETHSEYFLVRLRRRLAEGKLPRQLTSGVPKSITGSATRHELPFILNPRALRRSDVSVLLVEPTASRSVAKVLPINEMFQLENLPPEFMSQALKDRVAITQALRGKE